MPPEGYYERKRQREIEEQMEKLLRQQKPVEKPKTSKGIVIIYSPN
jgi:hypothetical protein